MGGGGSCKGFPSGVQGVPDAEFIGVGAGRGGPVEGGPKGVEVGVVECGGDAAGEWGCGTGIGSGPAGTGSGAICAKFEVKFAAVCGKGAGKVGSVKTA